MRVREPVKVRGQRGRDSVQEAAVERPVRVSVQEAAVERLVRVSVHWGLELLGLVCDRLFSYRLGELQGLVGLGLGWGLQRALGLLGRVRGRRVVLTQASERKGRCCMLLILRGTIS